MKIKNITNIIVFTIIIFGLFCSLLIKQDNLISKEERRYLTTKKSFEETKILDGSYSSVLDDYLLDQFPLRNSFRKLKSFSTYNIFNKIENQDIVIDNGYAIKLFPDYKYNNISYTINKLNWLQENLFEENDCYIAIIPDKSCFYSKFDNISCDYNKVENEVKNNINKNIKYISIGNSLKLDDYYKTDSHWTQDKIEKIANIILQSLNKTKNTYEINKIDNFYGVYYSQAALTINPDTIYYLTNDVLNSCTVFNYETNKTSPIYDLNKLNDEKSMDNYDIFLSGSASLLRIDNENAKSNDTLYVFRDSYGSSLTPLLINDYKTTYVVDLRYISYNMLKKIIKVNKNDDVLFIYSTLLINEPNNFKIK